MIKEHKTYRLKRDVTVKSHGWPVKIPEGSIVTVIDVYDDGDMAEVEHVGKRGAHHVFQIATSDLGPVGRPVRNRMPPAYPYGGYIHEVHGGKYTGPSRARIRR